MDSSSKAAIVVGGGLVGPAIALFLAELGHPVEIFERRPDPRQAGSEGGRSINITLCERGLQALDRLGLGDKARQLAIPARGRILHQSDGQIDAQPYGNRGEAIYSISRRELQEEILKHALAHPRISASFECKILDVDVENATARFLDHKTGQKLDVAGRSLFACDGAYSRVRGCLLHRRRFDYSQYFVPQGYKELRLPAAPDGSFALEPEAIHIWPRGQHMLIGFANRDGSFTLALHLPFEGDVSFATVHDAATFGALVERDFPDLLSQLPRLAHDFVGHAINPMITVRCSPWSFGDKLLLMGDACHAIVPSYGQGANCSFENCALLRDLLEAHGDDWGSAFRHFEDARKPEANAIADLALEHFEELQSLVADEDFLLRKQIERAIERRHPELFVPLYSLISFTTLPYTEALRRDRVQHRVVDELLRREGVLEQLAAGELDGLVKERLATLQQASNGVSQASQTATCCRNSPSQNGQ